MIEYGFFDSEITGYDEEGLPVFDRAKSSEFFAEFWKRLVSNGVLGEPADCFQVVSTGGMNISVRPGFGFILGHYVKDEAAVAFTIDPESTGKRIDLVVMRLNRVQRLIEIYVKKGTASNQPAAPTLVREEYGDYFELCLARILVDSTAQSITQSSITDTRMNSAVCGIVTCPIDHLDTSVYYQQIQQYFNEHKETMGQQMSEFETQLQGFYKDKGSEFTSWFDSIKGQLSGDVAANLASKVAELEKKTADLEENKLNKGTIVSVTISSASWTGESAPYTANVAVPELTGAETELVEVYVPYEATLEQKMAWSEAGIMSGNNVKGALILEALMEKPTVNITVSALIYNESYGNIGSGGMHDIISQNEINRIFERTD